MIYNVFSGTLNLTQLNSTLGLVTTGMGDRLSCFYNLGILMSYLQYLSLTSPVT